MTDAERWRSREIGSTIAALRAYAAEIRDAEVARALARLRGVSAREAILVRGLAERVVSNFLHRPVTVLEADAEGANMAYVLRRVFQLKLQAEQLGCDPPALDRGEAGPAARIPLHARL